MTRELTDRFLRYVAFDTQSSENSADQCPSTDKQFALARHIKEELETLGLTDVEMDEHAYVYATLPANIAKDVPTVGFIAHMDTSPDMSGKDVRPRIVRNYDGRDIVLNEAEGIVTRVALFPELTKHIGEDLIAGIAEIITAMTYLQAHPEIEHGRIRVAFNPDEEIGQGAHLFDVGKFGCQWAYTMDGSEVGELEYENFNAASAKVVIKGRNVHPGYAKGKMINANYLAHRFIGLLYPEERPETTEGYEGFFHLTSMSGTVEETTLNYIIRDHDRTKFEQRKRNVQTVVDTLNQEYGEGTVTATIRDQYYNMLEMLQDKPHVTDIAKRAIQEVCGHCEVIPIRGGTDGAQLSFRGLPCPNIFAGGLNFHGRHEFVPIQSMQKAMQTVVNICRLVAE